jgi:hypothetical protein
MIRQADKLLAIKEKENKMKELYNLKTIKELEKKLSDELWEIQQSVSIDDELSSEYQEHLESVVSGLESLSMLIKIIDNDNANTVERHKKNDLGINL